MGLGCGVAGSQYGWIAPWGLVGHGRPRVVVRRASTRQLLPLRQWHSGSSGGDQRLEGWGGSLGDGCQLEQLGTDEGAPHRKAQQLKGHVLSLRRVQRCALSTPVAPIADRTFGTTPHYYMFATSLPHRVPGRTRHPAPTPARNPAGVPDPSRCVCLGLPPLSSLPQPVPGTKVVVVFLSHFGDLTSWELAQKLTKVLPTLEASGVKVITVGLGSAAAAQVGWSGGRGGWPPCLAGTGVAVWWGTAPPHLERQGEGAPSSTGGVRGTLVVAAVGGGAVPPPGCGCGWCCDTPMPLPQVGHVAACSRPRPAPHPHLL